MNELNGRRIDIDAFQALIAIHRHGGVTRAAAVLGLSQSAVSHKIKRLEALLDSNLLRRRFGGPIFTAAGEELLDYANRILSLHDEALRSLSKTQIAGKISLGMTEDTASSDLARILSRFKRVHPSVAVRTKVRMSLVLREMLDRGEIDAAIMQVFADQVRPTDVVMFREKLHWVRHPELVISDGQPVPFLAFDDDCFYRQWAFEAGRDGVVLETVLECASAAGIVAAVNAGMGIALLSDRHVDGRMSIIRDRLPTPPPLAYIVRRGRRLRNPALDALVEEISEVASDRTSP